jgi:hypothetical protein
MRSGPLSPDIFLAWASSPRCIFDKKIPFEVEPSYLDQALELEKRDIERSCAA